MNKQRPLWASTGVKDAALPDTLYVTELAVAGVVNTMPEKTLEATADHAPLHGDAIMSRPIRRMFWVAGAAPNTNVELRSRPAGGQGAAQRRLATVRVCGHALD